MNIEDIILKKIKSSPAPPFLFVGSGLSQRYIGTPTWMNLLEHFSKLINEDELAFHMYLDEARRNSQSNGLEPKIAEILEADFNRAWFKESKFSENRKKFSEIIKSGVSPFKVEIADYFFKASNKPFKNGSGEEIELLKQVGDRSLAGIITTNYDLLIERVFSDYKYNKLIGQEELIFSPLTGVSEIYKIHGCCTNHKSIVINDKDYDKFNERNAYLVAKLLTIFLEHPIIFIGYGIGDANIKEILSSIVRCIPVEKLTILKDRFIFVEWNNSGKEDSISDYEFSNLNDDKSLIMTKVYINDFAQIYKSLLKNKVSYNPRLIKKMKEDIYNVVLTSKPTKTLNVLVDIDDSRLDEIEAVVGFGVMKELGHKGYDSVGPEELFEDIIFNNKNFIPSLIIEKSLPLILKYNQSIPMYKYVSRYQGEIEDKIKKHIDKPYSKLLSKEMGRKLRSDGYIKNNIRELIDKYGFEGALKYIIFIKPKCMDLNELHEYIRSYIEVYPDILTRKNCVEKTELKRLIKIYDYLKYKKKA